MSDRTKASLYRFVAILLGTSLFTGTLSQLQHPDSINWGAFGGSLLFALVMAAEQFVKNAPSSTATTPTVDEPLSPALKREAADR